jgi:hypothetical protein
MTENQTCRIPATERRFAFERRRRVAEMSTEEMRQELLGLEAYHDKGDEFLCRGLDAKELASRLECSRSILRNRAIAVNRTDGAILRIEGADFSYGVGHNLEEAELALRNHKAAFCRARFGIPNHYRFSLDLAFAHARRHARAPAHSLAIHSSFRPGV